MTNKEYAKIVSANLRKIALVNEKTQADIAKDLKLSKATVSSWMNGTRIPRMDKVDLLCNYFNCHRADIMEDSMPFVTDPPKSFVLCTDDERRMLSKYKKVGPDMQKMVLKLLDVAADKEK